MKLEIFVAVLFSAGLASIIADKTPAVKEIIRIKEFNTFQKDATVYESIHGDVVPPRSDQGAAMNSHTSSSFVGGVYALNGVEADGSKAAKVAKAGASKSGKSIFSTTTSTTAACIEAGTFGCNVPTDCCTVGQICIQGFCGDNN